MKNVIRNKKVRPWRLALVVLPLTTAYVSGAQAYNARVSGAELEAQNFGWSAQGLCQSNSGEIILSIAKNVDAVKICGKTSVIQTDARKALRQKVLMAAGTCDVQTCSTGDLSIMSDSVWVDGREVNVIKEHRTSSANTSGRPSVEMAGGTCQIQACSTEDSPIVDDSQSSDTQQ